MKTAKAFAVLIFSGAIIDGGGVAFAQTTSSIDNSATTAGRTASALAPDMFAQTAAASDAFEIASSQLALKRSQNADIKAFAQQMIGDHTQSSNELKAAATADGLTVDATLDAKHRDQLNMLQGTPAREFDEKYAAAQSIAHKEAVSLFGNYVSTGTTGAVKTFAAQTLPILQTHLQHAQFLAVAQSGKH